VNSTLDTPEFATLGDLSYVYRVGEYDMLNTVKAIVREGRIELLEQINLPEGAEVLVTILSEEDLFWRRSSEPSLSAVWNNTEDDIYEQLLKR
jgi:hypothetical protein